MEINNDFLLDETIEENDNNMVICTDARLRPIQKNISRLFHQAREYERWLLENTEAGNWFHEKAEYDNVLYKMAQQKMKLEAIRTGNIRCPETISLPARPNRNRGF